MPDSVDRVRATRGPKALAKAVDRQRLIEFWRYRQGVESKTDWWFLLPTAGLRRAHLPPPKAPWHSHLNLFSLSFDGYSFAGGMEALIALFDRHAQIFSGEGHLASDITIDAARACLLRIQRAWKYRAEDAGPDYDPGPYADELLFAWALVERLREMTTRP